MGDAELVPLDGIIRAAGRLHGLIDVGIVRVTAFLKIPELYRCIRTA